MKKTLLISLMLTFFLTVNTFAQSNIRQSEEAWKRINKLIEDQLPESAMGALDKWSKVAEAAQDYQEIIKTRLHQYRLRIDKDNDEIPAVLNDFESMITKFPDSAEKQLLYTMLAQMYQSFYLENSYTINRRTDIQGEQPEDIEVWTKRNFERKIIELYSKAIENLKLTQSTDLRRLEKLFILPEKFPANTQTLFDYIANSYLSSMNSFENEDETEKVFDEVMAIYRKNNQRDKLAMTEFEFMKFRFSDENSVSYIQTLDSLEIVYQDIADVVVDILVEKANYYLQQTDKKGHKRIAYRICVDGLKKYSNHPNAGKLTNIIHQISNITILVKNQVIVKPGIKQEIVFETENVTDLVVELYRINASAAEYQQSKLNYRGAEIPELNKILIGTELIHIPFNPDFESVTTKHYITTPTYGIYEYVAYPKDRWKKNQLTTGNFTVSDFTFIKRIISENKTGIYVVDRVSGKRIKNVDIFVYDYRWKDSQYRMNLNHQLKTNDNGYAEYEINNEQYSEILIFSKGQDKYFCNSGFGNNRYPPPPPVSEDPKYSIFTDRAIYRPGQTVYFKAIAYVSNKLKESVLENRGLKIELFDQNGQVQQTKTLTTNKFGSVSGEFILPVDMLNGSWHFEINGQYQSEILVEEYKRPTFEVLLTKPTQGISFGTQTTIDGEVKAYAGYAVSEARIIYQVVRRTHPFCYWLMPQNEDILENGTITTDAKGKFSVSFTPEKSKEYTDYLWKHSYLYEVKIDATDLRGETQAGSITIPVSEQSVFIVSEVPAKIDREKVQKVKISAQNILGESMKQSIDYALVQLKETDEYVENLAHDYVFMEGKTMLKGQYMTDSKEMIFDLKTYKSGRYKLLLSTKDEQGNEVKKEHIFILYNENDRQPAIKSYVWFSEKDIECLPGEKALIKFGTSAKNGHILMEVKQGLNTISSKWLKISNRINTFQIPFEKKYEDGLEVSFTFVKDEKLFSKKCRIIQKAVEKKITPVLSVFRDQLLPGEDAAWTVTIPDRGDKPTELMIGMYDATLDTFIPHEWIFSPNYNPWFPAGPGWSTQSKKLFTNYTQFVSPIVDVPTKQVALINWFGLTLAEYNRMYSRSFTKMNRRNMMMKSEMANEVVEILNVVEDDPVGTPPPPKVGDMSGLPADSEAPDMDIISEELDVINTAQAVSPTSLEQSQKRQIRTNFNETAFFYPQIYCDSLGNFRFSFKVPESLTRWNIKMLAHTQNLYSGQNEASVITKKDLMIQLQKPRFVRQSDTFTLSASLVNLSDSTIHAKVKILLADPATGEEIQYKADEMQTIPIGPGETKIISREIEKLGIRDIVVCRAEANTGNFFDGEQQYLAVLPDKMLVTESKLIQIRADETKYIPFNDWQNDGQETFNYQLEFTANPVWDAIYSLPVLTEPTGESSIDLFLAWYAGLKASQILADHPEIETVFSQLKQSENAVEILQSPLQKNEELKSILLQESPWVKSAQEESNMKQSLALLFNSNQQINSTNRYFKKLLETQLGNGAFPWYAGMGESRWVTQLIVSRSVDVFKKQLTSDERNFFSNAIYYLDKHMIIDYNFLKRVVKDYEKTRNIGTSQLEYLLIRNKYSEFEISKELKEAMDYYLKQTETYYKEFGLSDKAMAARILNETGKKELAGQIIRSLRELAIKSETLGMYWGNNKASYHYNDQALSVHCNIMQAFAEIGSNSDELDAMKIWLLRQKHTQQWNSTLATLDAIEALTNSGNQWTVQNNKFTWSSGSNKIEVESKIPGSGYIKETIQPDIIQSGITITSSTTNTGSSPAWGAIYRQYYADFDKLTDSGSGLNISKTYHVEQIKEGQKILIPLDANRTTSTQKVNKGDRIVVRLIVKADRNYEFVALKDIRSSCLEPLKQLSGCEWKENLLYYRTSKDASTQYFFDHLPQGTYVFEDSYFVTNSGDFSGGAATISCQYAPEFTSTASAKRIQVE